MRRSAYTRILIVANLLLCGVTALLVGPKLLASAAPDAPGQPYNPSESGISSLPDEYQPIGPHQFITQRASDLDWASWCDADVLTCEIRDPLSPEFSYVAPGNHVVTGITAYSYSDATYYVFPMTDGVDRCWGMLCVTGAPGPGGFGLEDVTVRSTISTEGESLNSPVVDVVQVYLAYDKSKQTFTFLPVVANLIPAVAIAPTPEPDDGPGGWADTHCNVMPCPLEFAEWSKGGLR